MSDVPKKFDAEYYDQNYFSTPRGKKFLGADGKLYGWSYNNPTGEFLGAGPIAKAWKEVFNPKDMLDVGAGRGTFIAYARDAGINAVGFDWSPWAVGEGRYERCKEEWLKRHDATKRWPYETDGFELVVVLDFFEHIYEDDLDFVIGETFRVAKDHVFIQTAVAGSGGLQGEAEGYVLKKGEPIPQGFEGLAVAGHVTLRSEAWWYERLDHDDWMPRRDMVQHFISLVDDEIIRNWLLNSIIVMERV